MNGRYNIIQRRARGKHACDICGHLILPGCEYLTIKEVWKGRTEYHKSHIHCHAIADAYLKARGKDAEWSWETYRVITWMNDKACLFCPHEHSEKCRARGRELFGCSRIMRMLLPLTVLPAALESIKANIEV